MSLNKVYIFPHGDEIIDLPDDHAEQMNHVIRNLVEKDDSDVLVIISPHGLTLGQKLAVINTEFFYANTELKNKTLKFKATNERNLTEEIIEKESQLCQEVRFSTYSGELSAFPLDFGSAIPLYFFKQRSIVVMGQPRIDDRASLENFGKTLYNLSKKYPKKVSIIISADQAHTHSSLGPYGYSERAIQYEEILKEAIGKNDLSVISTMDSNLIKEAKPDSYWNMLILKGIMESSGLRMKIDYHYVAVYFGMLLAHSE
jgi:aromatic ring-opening dioxygenase LigB subunit